MSTSEMSPARLRQRMLRAAGRSRSHAVRYSSILLVLVDTIAIMVAVLAAVLGRNHLPIFQSTGDVNAVAQGVSVPIGLLWLLVIFVLGGYAPAHTGVGSLELNRLTMASVTTAGLVGITCYLAKFQLSRGLFLLLFIVGVPLLLIGRLFHRRSMHRMRAQGHFRTRILLAGSGRNIDDIGRVLQRESWLGHDVVGALTSTESPITETRAGVPIVGHTDGVLKAVERLGVDAVIFTEGSFSAAEDFRRMAWTLEEHKVQMIVVPKLTDVARERIQVRPVAGLPLVYVGQPQSLAAGRWMKRAFDIVGSLALMIMLSPVVAFAAIWIKIHDGGPIVFRQIRAGKDGIHFACMKFRSMVVDADAFVADLSHLNETDGPLFKMVEDPRITLPGRFIRRYSLDEVPQLWNVLRGDMSLVGPRPPLPREVSQYESDAFRRLRVRPGMTGLWQVSGRSDLPWEETVRLDLYYVDNWSIFQDLLILTRTISAVLSGRGAY